MGVAFFLPGRAKDLSAASHRYPFSHRQCLWYSGYRIGENTERRKKNGKRALAAYGNGVQPICIISALGTIVFSVVQFRNEDA